MGLIGISYHVYGASLFVLCGICAALVYFFTPIDRRWSLGSKRWAMPPGPPGVPVLGNLRQMMDAREGGPIALNQWLVSLMSYGEMATLHMGSHTWVVLNSARVTLELIAKRGKVTNERPPMPVASDLVSNRKRVVIQQEAEWREGRRVMHQLLSGSHLKVYASMQELESVDMLRRYLREPNLWFSHNFRYATSVLYRVVMGYPLNKTKTELDDYQTVAAEFIGSINGSYVDFFPAITKLPRFLQTWRPFWARIGAAHRRLLQEWWHPVRTAVVKGSAPPSFVRDVLLHPDMRYLGNDDDAMYLASSVMAAGGDNLRMAINTFIMAMITRPDVQAKAREEVDRVCTDGKTLRLPRISDLADMPYVASMVKEVLRWRPTVPLIPPHQLTDDIKFDGHLFPAGTVLVINSIALSSEFDDANDFKPERWLEGEGADAYGASNFWFFGGGRRMCVGWKVAQQALFIAFSRFVYSFELTPNGPVDDKILNHRTVDEPFPVKITVRSAEHAALIEEEASKYEASFSTFSSKSK
ncbi:cytochrome P450 2C31 [Xylaria arbuscula]|nr:cytochrome P450 2C31 [Xylaria arbuscula]